MPSPRGHVKAVLDYFAQIIETNLKSSLGLNRILLNKIEYMPTAGVAAMAPMILMAPSGAPTTYEPVQLPSKLAETINLRIVYIRKIKEGEDPVAAEIDEAEDIIDFLWDNFRLSSLDITNGDILWATLRSVDWEPVEDAFAATIASDLQAVAFEVEVAIRTRR